MDKLPIKLKELSPVIVTMIEKIQLLDSNILTKEEKVKCANAMIEDVDNFRQFFAKTANSVYTDEASKIFNEKIERAFSLFDWDTSVGVAPYEFRKYSENGKSLISSVLKLLGTKGCGILIIETYLKLCMKIITEMTGNIENSYPDATNFKLLLEGFSFTVNVFKKYWHIVFLPNQKSIIMLCLSQMCKGLSLLFRMIEVNNIEIKKFFLNVLTQCLSKIMDEIHCEGQLHPKDCGQEFIIMMEFCIYNVNDLLNNNIDFANYIQKANEIALSLKPVIDELLCYVMSIAQVTCFKEDHDTIVASSHKVLKEYNDLKNSIIEQNKCDIKLNASSIGETLCSLEQKVNTAVLRLVLEVFSGINCPLKNMVNKCRTDIGKCNKVSDDLNVLIKDFDAEMDKIMQIGLFAISCTTDLKRILGIQSCLASLESLESELITSLTVLYMDCHAGNKANFQYLIDFWLTEISELKVLIDSILDPACFCEIVKIQVKSLVQTVKDDLNSEDKSPNKMKSCFKQIIRYSRKLMKTLKTSFEDSMNKDKIGEILKNFQLGVQECEAIFDILDKKEDSNITYTQALKRCDFLLEQLHKLHLHLLSMVSFNDAEYNATEKSKIIQEYSDINIKVPQENYYSFSDEPQEITLTKNDIDLLTPYINRGITRSKKRNILYGTPSKIEKGSEDEITTVLQTRHWSKTPISRKRSRCCKPLDLSTELENTIDLEITTILENISQLSSTFSKSNISHNYCTEKSIKEGSLKKRKDASCGMDKNNLVSPFYTSTGCCTDFTALEIEKTEDGSEDEESNFLGTKLRAQFLQSLEELSQNTSLLADKDEGWKGEIDTPERLNDLKSVQQKINFLKQRVPDLLP